MMSSDDPTRAGGTGVSRVNETKVSSRRIQVRMPSGKIYGPYQRSEVLKFIAAKKIKGEESILFDGTSEWQPISSDPEFFDAIKDAQFGRTRVRGTSSVAAENSGTSAGQKTSVGALPGAAPGLPPAPRKQMPLELQVNPSVYETESPSASIPSLDFESANSANRLLKAARKANPRVVALGAIVLAGAAFVALNPGSSGPAGGVTGFQTPSLQARLAYLRPLAAVLDEVHAVLPTPPAQLTAVAVWNLPAGIGAHIWTEDLQKLLKEERPEARAAADYWGRLAWDLKWLATVLVAADPAAAKRLAKEGDRVLGLLQDKKLVPPAEAALFESIGLFESAKWGDVQAKLSPLKDSEFAQWLAEESSWWAFWEAGAAGRFARLKENYASPSLETLAKARAALVAKDRDRIPEALDDLAMQDPRACLLWFVSGEFFWRLNSDQVQRANNRFVTGLAALSLAPLSIQSIYWKQYVDFLTAFGRQSTAARGLANLDALRAGALSKPETVAAWWDLGQEGLDTTRIANDVLARGGTAPLPEADIASLEVLGAVLPSGAQVLTAAGQHMAFEEEWGRAIKMFDSALKADPKYTGALGGLVWANASLYKFDKAYEAADRLGKIPTEGSEATLYNGVISLYGREYADAAEQLAQYVKSAPTDPWGHYFRAQLALRNEKNIECMKAANLAIRHGKGEVGFRSGLLFERCQILSGIRVKQTVDEMRASYAKTPRNIPLILALTGVLKDLDVVDEALKITDEALRKFPHSAKLYLRMGELYEKRRDFDRALAFYEAAHRERHDSAEPSIKIARIFEQQGQPLKAAEAYVRGSIVDSEYPEIWLMAARAYDAAGKWQDAAKYYVMEIDERPAVVTTLIEAAEFMLKINAPQEVPKLMQKAKTGFGDDPRVLTRLAQAYLAMRDYENARITASSALARNQTIAEPHRVLAVIQEQQGIFDGARSEYETYLQLLPQAPDADQIRMKLSRPPFAQ